MLAESLHTPTLAPDLPHTGGSGGPKLIRIGDLVAYRGSIHAWHGPALYRGLCGCARPCAHDPRATVQLLRPDRSVIRHVSCTSFASAEGEPPGYLRAAADRLRTERVLIEVSLTHRMSGRPVGGADPAVIAWHPIAAERGPGACRLASTGTTCPRCASAALVRAALRP